MVMDFKKAKVEGRMSTVVSIEELQTNRELYDTGTVSVEITKTDGETVVLPYRPNAVRLDRPGVYQAGNVGDMIVYPDEKNKAEYQPEVIDLSNSSSIEEYMIKQGKLKDIEKEILTTPDNIFTPHISDEDSPLMKGLKKAVIKKHIDIDKYADGYGENFPNDKRKFKDHDISIKLFERHVDVLGIKAVLVLTDASPDIPNPIVDPIYIPLNYSEDNSEGEEEDGEDYSE
jgi:hypothetical protein